MPGRSRPKTATTSVICTLPFESRHDVNAPKSGPSSPPRRAKSASIPKAYDGVAEQGDIRIFIEVAKRCLEQPEILEQARQSPRFQEALKRQGLEWVEVASEQDVLYKTKLLTDVFLERKRVTKEAEEGDLPKRRFKDYIEKLNQEETLFLDHERRRQNASERVRDARREQKAREEKRSAEIAEKQARMLARKTGNSDASRDKAKARDEKVQSCTDLAIRREEEKRREILDKRTRTQTRMDARERDHSLQSVERKKKTEEETKMRQNRHKSILQEKQARRDGYQLQLNEKMNRSQSHKDKMSAELAAIRGRSNLRHTHRLHNCLRQERKNQYFLAKMAEDIEVGNVQRVLQEELRNAVRVQRKNWEKSKKEHELRQADEDRELKEGVSPGPDRYRPWDSEKRKREYTFPKQIKPVEESDGPGPASYATHGNLNAGFVKWSVPYRPPETLESAYDPNQVWRKQQAALSKMSATNRSLSPGGPPVSAQVSPRPPYASPGPGAYSRAAPRTYRTVDDVLDDFDVLCTKYAERIQGSPKMRARSASLLQMPSERKELISVEGFASPLSPLDRTLTRIQSNKDLSKEDLNARGPKYQGPTYLSSAPRRGDSGSGVRSMINNMVNYKTEPSSPREIQTLNVYHKDGTVSKRTEEDHQRTISKDSEKSKNQTRKFSNQSNRTNRSGSKREPIPDPPPLMQNIEVFKPPPTHSDTIVVEPEPTVILPPPPSMMMMDETPAIDGTTKTVIPGGDTQDPGASGGGISDEAAGIASGVLADAASAVAVAEGTNESNDVPSARGESK